MSLPYFQSGDRQFSLMQTGWKQSLDPLLANPLSQGILLENIVLVNGVTVVNHLLGRKLQGWVVADINAAATIYRSAPLNNLTLTLTSSAIATVALYVF